MATSQFLFWDRIILLKVGPGGGGWGKHIYIYSLFTYTCVYVYIYMHMYIHTSLFLLHLLCEYGWGYRERDIGLRTRKFRSTAWVLPGPSTTRRCYLRLSDGLIEGTEGFG